MPVLVENVITESVPGASTVRFGMDFGNLPEIVAGDTLISFTVAINTVTIPPLTYDAGSFSVDGGYLASALFSGGTAGTYYIKWTPTLTSGQTLPPRIGQLILEATS